MVQILLVEDDTENLETISLLLGIEGYVVTGVPNGREALDLLEAGMQPALVLTDLTMPILDGRELLGHLRRSPLFRSIPVLVMSAEFSVDDVAAHYRVLRKPFSIDTLLQAVRAATHDALSAAK